ncbi:hypothetical protein HDU79_005420 [Rhizoclosmatium sp. JEL0117]|nr:hypothetical protein HDU79_005420 [Rhizoclosmatium sp. JEL0117]
MTHFVQKPISKDLMQGILKQYYTPRRTKTLRMNSPDRPEQILEDVLSVMSTPEAMFRQPPTRRQTSGSAAGGSDKGSSLDRPSRSITPENASGNIGGTVVTPPEPTERPISQPISHSFYPENTTTFSLFRSQASAYGMQRGPFETGTLPNPTEKYAALVVDDSLVNKAILVRMLEKFGKFNEILEVSSGAEAVKMCQTRKVSIVFMDLEMPGMNGEEAAARIRAAGSTMPIVAVTGNTIKGDDAGPLRQVGIIEIVKKPVEIAKIFELCKTLIQFKNVDNSTNLTVTTSSSGPNSTMRLNHGASGLMVNHAPGYGTMKRMANASTSVMAERDSRGGQ